MITSILNCISCNKSLQDALCNSTSYPNLPVMLSAFIVLAIIISLAAWLSIRRFEVKDTTISHQASDQAHIPLAAASVVLGIAVGGFCDGIVFHEILQWHGMLTNKIAANTLINKNVNVFWDGIFFGFIWITTIIGLYLLWQLLHRPFINRSGLLLSGGMFLGWGIFNFAEGLINHHILGLHNIREASANPESWNYGFLAFSVLLILLGYILIKKGKADRLVFGEEQ